MKWDVVIAGGGMVGLSLALALAKAGGSQRRILVVERATLPPPGVSRPSYRPSFDARSTALSRGSELILRDLGVWERLAEHVAAIDHIHVSQLGNAGSSTLHATEQGWPALGHVIENAWLGAVLLAAVRTHSAIELRSGSQLQKPGVGADSVELECLSGGQVERLQARLLCIADGVGSPLAAALGIASECHQYEHSALIANVASERSHGGWAYERFTRHGPMALLPLPENDSRGRSALVWSLPPAQAEQLSTTPGPEFLARLQQRFGFRQGRLTAVGERAVYPLSRSTACEQVRRRICVIGNAAHALHPVAGQGFNLALRDVARLAVAIAASEDPGELSLLQKYHRTQRPDQQRTVAFSHYLPQLFELPWPGLAHARGLGLAALDLLPGLKQRFVATAAGCAPGAALGIKT